MHEILLKNKFEVKQRSSKFYMTATGSRLQQKRNFQEHNAPTAYGKMINDDDFYLE